MTSKLDITEFTRRLNENTKIGSVKYNSQGGIFSFFIDDSKSFYGQFDDSCFDLIINSKYIPHRYSLKGTYKASEENLIVNYDFNPISKFEIFWITYIPIIAFFLINPLIYLYAEQPGGIYFVVNTIIVFAIILRMTLIPWQNKRLKKKFDLTFEIIE